VQELTDRAESERREADRPGASAPHSETVRLPPACAASRREPRARNFLLRG
jgi:hypothetical protein